MTAARRRAARANEPPAAVFTALLEAYLAEKLTQLVLVPGISEGDRRAILDRERAEWLSRYAAGDARANHQEAIGVDHRFAERCLEVVQRQLDVAAGEYRSARQALADARRILAEKEDAMRRAVAPRPEPRQRQSPRRRSARSQSRQREDERHQSTATLVPPDDETPYLDEGGTRR